MPTHTAPAPGVPTGAATLRYPAPPPYTDRAGKAAYIATKYAPILAGSVLDVGCDERQLSRLLPAGATYFGVDMNPKADLRVDLETGVLPFADASFDTVIAADVLEHLEQIHAVFDELCRVARHRVNISLPNPIMSFLHSLAQGWTGTFKYYGLPLDRPSDRHRWFFGSEEAERFVRDRGARNGLSAEQIDFEDYPEPPPYYSRSGRPLTVGPSFTRGTMWAVLAKPSR